MHHIQLTLSKLTIFVPTHVHRFCKKESRQDDPSDPTSYKAAL